MSNLNFGIVMNSRLPGALGKSATDFVGVSRSVNQAQEQLVKAGGETGWWGGWRKVVFNVCRANPYVTLPRAFARMVNVDVCRTPVAVQNEFYEMLPAGVGLQDFNQQQGLGACRDGCGPLAAYERGAFPTLADLCASNQLVGALLTDQRDIGRRVLIGPCQDQNGNWVYSTDAAAQVNGLYLTLDANIALTPFIITTIGGVQKDPTYGDVVLVSVDATTGAQVTLARYGPDEISPLYRRYYFNRLPHDCCEPQTPVSPCVSTAPSGPGYAQITAMCKLEPVPVARPTDFLVIQSLPALLEECKANRYADMDAQNGPALQVKSHKQAIKYLNDELRHYYGELQPAVNFAPFGTARLSRVMRAVRNG